MSLSKLIIILLLYTIHMYMYTYMYVPGLYLGLSSLGHIDNCQIKGGMGVAKHFSCALHTRCNNPTINFINPRYSTVYIVLHNMYYVHKCTHTLRCIPTWNMKLTVIHMSKWAKRSVLDINQGFRGEVSILCIWMVGRGGALAPPPPKWSPVYMYNSTVSF